MSKRSKAGDLSIRTEKLLPNHIDADSQHIFNRIEKKNMLIVGKKEFIKRTLYVDAKVTNSYKFIVITILLNNKLFSNK